MEDVEKSEEAIASGFKLGKISYVSRRGGVYTVRRFSDVELCSKVDMEHARVRVAKMMN